MEIEKTKEYYETRLNFIKKMFFTNEVENLAIGKDKIANLIYEYKKFPNFDKEISGAVEFILTLI